MFQVHAFQRAQHHRRHIPLRCHQRVAPHRFHFARVQPGQRQFHGSLIVERLDLREDPRSTVIAHDHLIAQTFDQWFGDRGRYRRDQMHPIGRKAWGQHGYRNEPALQTARFGVAEHHVAVGQHIRAADLDGLPDACGRFQRGNQILQHVTDADGLDASVKPTRADHHRQTFDQITDQLKGDAARTDDHPGAKLGHRHAAFTQRVSRFLARAQMLRKLRFGIPQPAQVDNAPDPHRGRGRAERARGQHVPFVEALPASHAVDQVIGRGHTDHRRRQCLGLQGVAGNHLDLIQPGAALQPLGITHQTADAVTRLEQAWRQAPTDVTGGPGNQNKWGSCSFNHRGSPSNRNTDDCKTTSITMQHNLCTHNTPDSCTHQEEVSLQERHRLGQLRRPEPAHEANRGAIWDDGHGSDRAKPPPRIFAQITITRENRHSLMI